MPKNRRWPENCVWPEPAWNGGGIWWEEDEVDPMLRQFKLTNTSQYKKAMNL